MELTKANSNNHFFRRVFRFVLKHWYIFPLIKLTVVSTLLITLAEDGLVQPRTGCYICNHMYTGVSHFSLKLYDYGVLSGESGSSPPSRCSANLVGAGDTLQEGEEHKVQNSWMSQMLACLFDFY